jgi:hypothetical protein
MPVIRTGVNTFVIWSLSHGTTGSTINIAGTNTDRFFGAPDYIDPHMMRVPVIPDEAFDWQRAEGDVAAGGDITIVAGVALATASAPVPTLVVTLLPTTADALDWAVHLAPGSNRHGGSIGSHAQGHRVAVSSNEHGFGPGSHAKGNDCPGSGSSNRLGPSAHNSGNAPATAGRRYCSRVGAYSGSRRWGNYDHTYCGSRHCLGPNPGASGDRPSYGGWCYGICPSPHASNHHYPDNRLSHCGRFGSNTCSANHHSRAGCYGSR